MLTKLIKDAGFVLIRIEDQQCLLKCVETLQKERDKYRDVVATVFNLEDVGHAEEHF